MGRERQKKKNRSSLPKTKPTLHGRTKHGKKKVNFLGNPVIAENWDRNLTLLQNYKRLGLTSRLNAPTGGTEKTAAATTKTGIEHGRSTREQGDVLAIPTTQKMDRLLPTEARVERDPATGRILRVIPSEAESRRQTKRRRLDDPLNSESDPDSDWEEVPRSTSTDAMGRPSTSVIAELEAQAEEEAAQLARTRRPRQQSKREEEWIARLVQRYGSDFAAMARDKRLNPMQQTKGDIARRVRKWRGRKDDGGEVGTGTTRI